MALFTYTPLLFGNVQTDVLIMRTVVCVIVAVAVVVVLRLHEVAVRRYSAALADAVSRDGLAICSGQVAGSTPTPARCYAVGPAPQHLLTALYGATAPAPAIWRALMSVLPPDAPSRLVLVLGPFGCPRPKIGEHFSVVLHPANQDVAVLVGPIRGPIDSDPRWASARTPRQAAGGWWWQLGWAAAGAAFGIALAIVVAL